MQHLNALISLMCVRECADLIVCPTLPGDDFLRNGRAGWNGRPVVAECFQNRAERLGF